MRGVAVSVVVVVLLIAAGAAAGAHAEGVAPLEGSWKGETSASLPVYFGVVAGRVVNTRFSFRWGFCGTYQSHDPSADLEVDPNGHWEYDDPRGQTLEGTFVAPDRVEGKVISVERELPGCPRTEATFTATPIPPNPENIAAARAGIEALPFEIHLRAARGAQNVLIGKVFGSLGGTFRFFLFVNRNPAAHLRGVPGYGFHGRRHRIPDRSIAGGPLANTDALFTTVPRSNESEAQQRERLEIISAIESTVCLRQTGADCPSREY